MALIDRIVDIRITRNTLGVTKNEFSTILIIGEPVVGQAEPKFGEYSSLSEVMVDYGADTYEYQMARNIFIQDIVVRKILIAQRGNLETLLEAYERMNATHTFYAVCTSNDVHADIMPLASAIEASKTTGQSHILSLLEEDPAIDADSDMKKTFDAKLDRTNVWFSNRPNPTPPDTTISYLQAAILGRMLPTDPGSANWAGKSVKGIAADTATNGGLTNAIIAKIESVNGNFYGLVGNNPTTFNGKMASGEYIDIIYGIDWLENTMQQDVADVYRTTDKVPYTSAGIALVETAMMKSLELAKSRGVILSYKIITPDISTIPFNDKATRQLKNMKFEAVLVGAINQVFINGYVTL